METQEPLLSVSPKSMAEDEHVIAKGYRSMSIIYLAIIPFVIAFFFDTKYVIAMGVFLVLLALNETNGRLYDLCIRLKRTNAIISQSKDKDNSVY